MRYKTLPKTFVYAIGREEGPVKIGYAKNPKRRLSELQCACPFKLELLHTAEVANRLVAQAHESSIRRVYEEYYLRGEWFSFDADVARDAIHISIATDEAFQ